MTANSEGSSALQGTRGAGALGLFNSPSPSSPPSPAVRTVINDGASKKPATTTDLKDGPVVPAPGWGRRWLFQRANRRALISYAAVLAVWQLGATSGRWLGTPLPWIGILPAPTAVLASWAHLIVDPGYWTSWGLSLVRVLGGFGAATLVGIPFGLMMALSAWFRGIAFPVFELLRPIPPLAWVPAAIIFWPTQELSIAFVIFLGAFYTIVINVLGGVESIDTRLIQVARSMGASRRNIFGRIILPAVLPSILVGMEVSIGITWEVVVAAEMISGGGGSGSMTSGGGLGFFIWNSYVGGSYPQIVVGMISIGVAGYFSSAGLRWLARHVTPWLKAQ